MKQPGSLLRHMPVWGQDEVLLCREHIFSTVQEAEVRQKFSVWGGIPRFVLQFTDMEHQRLLDKAVKDCSITDLATCMQDISKATKASHRLLHMSVDADYLEGPVVFASAWVRDSLIQAYLQGQQQQVRAFMEASGGEPLMASFRGKLWEHHAQRRLQGGGRFLCRDLCDVDKEPFFIVLEEYTSSPGVWDSHDIAELADGVFGWCKNKVFPAIDVAVQPDKLFQVTVSGDHRIDVRGLVDAVRAMRAPVEQVRLYFVVTPDVFSRYSKQTLKRNRGYLEAAHLARSVSQYVLKLDFV